MTDISVDAKYTEGVAMWGKGSFRKDTVLIDELTGEKHTLEEWSKLNKKITVKAYAFNKKKIVLAQIDPPFLEGRGKIYKVKTKSGKIAFVTGDHKFITSKGWTKLKNIKVGDKIKGINENSASDKIEWKVLENIEEVEKDDYYGVTVPAYKNYFLQGFLNHNSGKDFCSGICIARIIYQLLCLKNPQKEFGFAEDSFIDAMNIAVNASQASHVFFQPFRNMINRAKIFRKLGFDDKLNEIVFPKHLRAFSGHSDQEGLEGHTLIFAVLDEIAAFPISEDALGSKIIRVRDANVIYDSIRSSIQSRFPGVGKIVSISFPRYKDDFIMKLVELRKNDPSTYVSAGIPTWVANPIRTKADFDDEYRKNPETAKSKYECIPPYAEEPYFRDVAVLNDLFENSQLLSRLDGISSGINAYESVIPEIGNKYCIHIDLGLKVDLAGIAMAHGTGNGLVIVDFAFTISPEENREINFSHIRELIFKLKNRGLSIERVTLDNYQSADFIQILKDNRIKCELLSIDRNTGAYDTLKELIYGKRIVFRFFERKLLEELLGLQLVRANKVDHLPGKSKDLADAVAGACFSAVQFPKMIRHANLGDLGSLFTGNEMAKEKQDAFKALNFFNSDNLKNKCPICNSQEKFTIVNGKNRCETCFALL